VPNNVVSRNINFKPGVNRRLIVTRVVSNKARMETRAFSTTQFVCADKACQHEDEFFNT